MAPLRPFFPYYGSKWRSSRLYPPPRHGVVVEPFAGSAGYATYWNPPRVNLLDRDPVIASVWDYLIHASTREVRALPDLEVGEDVRSLPLSQEAQWLIGFWLNRGSAQPKRRRTAYSARTDRAQLVWGERARERIAGQLDAIRHWTIAQLDYRNIIPLRSTWFVDPPYEVRGRHYSFHRVDYGLLGDWARRLPGQVIVCENAGATWLPFASLANVKSTRGRSEEVVWTNDEEMAA